MTPVDVPISENEANFEENSRNFFAYMKNLPEPPKSASFFKILERRTITHPKNSICPPRPDLTTKK